MTFTISHLYRHPQKSKRYAVDQFGNSAFGPMSISVYPVGVKSLRAKNEAQWG